MAGTTRSPNYPALSLPSALGHLFALAERKSRAPLSAPDAAAALGFGSLSGSAKVALGALNQFGLVSRRNGSVTLTELGARLGRPNEDSFVADIHRAARTPKLFQEVTTTLRQPSDSEIAEYLLTKRGFAPRGVTAFLRAFRETFEFVGSYPLPGTQQADETADDAAAESVQPQGQLRLITEPTAVALSRELSSLPEGEAMLQWPTHLSAASVREMEVWLLWVLERLKRRYAVQ